MLIIFVSDMYFLYYFANINYYFSESNCFIHFFIYQKLFKVNNLLNIQ